MHVPIIVGGVHRDETCGEIFDIVPTTVELLQKVSMVVVDAMF